MPLRVSELAKTRRTVTFSYEVTDGKSESVSVTYNPRWFTAQKEAELRDVSDAGHNTEWLARTLSAMVTGWDVLDDKGKEFTPTYDHMAALPSAFLDAVYVAIRDDIRPNLRTAGTSGGGSDTGAA